MPTSRLLVFCLADAKLKAVSHCMISQNCDVTTVNRISKLLFEYKIKPHGSLITFPFVSLLLLCLTNLYCFVDTMICILNKIFLVGSLNSRACVCVHVCVCVIRVHECFRPTIVLQIEHDIHEK